MTSVMVLYDTGINILSLFERDLMEMTTQKEAQSSSDNISPVNEPLPPSPYSSLEENYSETDLEQQTVRSPNSAPRKIAHTEKMSNVSNSNTIWPLS